MGQLSETPGAEASGFVLLSFCEPYHPLPSGAKIGALLPGPAGP